MQILPRNRFLRFLVRWFVIPILSLILLVLLTALVMWVIGSARLSAQLSKARELGCRLSWKEVVSALPAKPSQKQGTKLLQQAFLELESARTPNDVLKLLPVEGLLVWKADQPLPPDAVAAVSARIKQTQGITEKVRTAAPLGANFSASFSNINDLVSHGHLGRYRECCRILAESALLNAQRGNGDAAIDDICCGIQLATTLETYPGVIGALVREACIGIFKKPLEFILANSKPSEEGLRTLLSMLKKEEAFSFRKSMMDEIAFWTEMFDRCGSGEFGDRVAYFFVHGNVTPALHQILEPSPYVQVVRKAASASFPLCRGWIQLDEAKCLEINNACVASWDLDWDSFSQKTAHVRNISSFYPIAHGLSEGLFNAKKEDLVGRSEIQCIQIGILAELFRRANGRLPDKPSDLVPGLTPTVPNEPFAHQPIQFEKRTGGIEIYFAAMDDVWGPESRPYGRHCYSFVLYRDGKR